MFELIPYQKFRDPPSVRFFDITVPASNARDMVVHSGPAVSPPDDAAAVESRFAPAEVVHEDQDDVGLWLPLEAGGQQKASHHDESVDAV